MSTAGQNLSNLLEYVGLRSRSYYHSVPEPIRDFSDPLAYYVDFSSRANYNGPFDQSGLPLMADPTNPRTFPTHLAIFALANLELYRRNRTEENLNRVRICAEWFKANQESDGAWLSTFPKQEFGLKPPFRSAMIQGLAISALCRMSRALDDNACLETAVRALGPFRHDVADNGVTTSHDAGLFYEEYPCRPPCHVLNGFIYALWGLRDLAQTGNADAAKLWESGLKTLIAWLPRYDLGYWSLYHVPETPRNPATVAYHRLHINQLEVMYALTSTTIFKEYTDRWRGSLAHRTNALRSLPSKLMWVLTGKSTFEH
jgi:heparosan-N-sulfate-glucuronate 5-epimerase